MQTKPPLNMERLRELIAHGEPWAAAALAIFWSFMAPVWPLLAVALFMVVADQITGRRAARKRGEAMSIAGKMRTVEKIFSLRARDTWSSLYRLRVFFTGSDTVGFGNEHVHDFHLVSDRMD